MQKFIITPSGPLPFDCLIEGQDARHITRTLRMGKGNDIRMTDARGTDYSGTIIDTSKHQVNIRVTESWDSKTESPLRLILCTAMLKDKKMDRVIKEATQLGICDWIPFYSERAVPRPSTGPGHKRMDRWGEIAKESIKQCQRSRLPQIHEPLSFNEMLKQVSTAELKIAFWEKAATPFSTLSPPATPKSAAILIGPEGGLTELEVENARDAGFIPYLIGPRILRAETAACVCCALTQHLLGDM